MKQNQDLSASIFRPSASPASDGCLVSTFLALESFGHLDDLAHRETLYPEFVPLGV